MKFFSSFFRRALWVALFVYCLASVRASAQTSQFGFDPSGNLLTQSGETLALPQIIGQPQTQLAVPGEFVSFFVVPADKTGLSYQWNFNGSPIGGATADTLVLTNVSAAREGSYFVVLSNNFGSVTSSVAMLYIDSRGVGMPDSWQLQYFGNLTQNPSGDFDNDGVSNLQEFLDGTNPTNKNAALFRLTVLNNGGTVDVSPNQATYTNGQVVTLTASAIAPYSFRGWVGDVSGNTAPVTNNPITITMTTNKTVTAYLGAFDVTWTNSNGDWFNPSNWSPNVVPGQFDNVFLPVFATITANSNIDCASLYLGLAGPQVTISGTGTLTVHQDSFWYSGIMSGAGKTVVPAGVTLSLLTANAHFLTSWTLENHGTIVCPDAGSMQLNGGIVTNAPGALFDCRAAFSISGSGGSNARFDNSGTFRKSIDTGTLTFNFPLNNNGLLDIQAGGFQITGAFVNNGTLNLPSGVTATIGGGGSATGTFVNPPGSLVLWTGNAFVGPYVLNPGTHLTGNGVYRVDGTTVTFNADQTFQFFDFGNTAGGTINGTASIAISNVMNWFGGNISGSGTLFIASNATMNIPNTFNVTTDTRTFDNAGTISWTGTALIGAGGNVFTNRPGALFLVANSAPNFSGGSRFDNAGTFRKINSVSALTFNFPFNNYSLVDLQAGEVDFGVLNNYATINMATNTTNRITRGGTFTGPFNTGANCLVEFSGNGFTSPFNLNPGGQLNGPGIYRLSGQTFNFNTDTIVQNLDDFATLAGNSNVTVTGTMNWGTGATVGGSGTLFISPGAFLSVVTSPFTVTLNRILDNAGTVVWTGGASINVTSTQITNRPSGLFDAQVGADLSSASSHFDNAGTFRKSVSTGTLIVHGNFNNYGTVDIRTGIFNEANVFNSFSNSLLNCTIGGTNVGSGYAQLQGNSTVSLNGALSVAFTNGYSPAANDSFTLVQAGSRSGSFASFSYPSNQVTMQISNIANTVVARIASLIIPAPFIYPPQISGTSFLLTWSTVPNATYRAEFNPDLTVSNWSPLGADVLALSNSATKVDPLTPTNRYYRVRVLP